MTRSEFLRLLIWLAIAVALVIVYSWFFQWAGW